MSRSEHVRHERTVASGLNPWGPGLRPQAVVIVDGRALADAPWGMAMGRSWAWLLVACACGASSHRSTVDPDVIIEDGRLVIIDAGSSGHVPLEVHFEVDSAILGEDSIPMLLVLAEFIESSAIERIEIQGHTDEQGTPFYNRRLSRERADSVKAFLVEAGIEASRLQTKGLGQTEPLSRDGSPEARARNRRVEFVILD